MKVKKKSVWRDKQTGKEVRVARLRKDEICYYPKQGGGAETWMKRTAFLVQHEPADADV